MKVIELLNRIANDEAVPKRIRIDHWCYEFEWVEHLNNYYDKQADIDLMSALSCDKEEFNYEVHELKQEDKKIEKLEYVVSDEEGDFTINGFAFDFEQKMQIIDKINEIIDKINEE